MLQASPSSLEVNYTTDHTPKVFGGTWSIHPAEDWSQVSLADDGHVPPNLAEKPKARYLFDAMLKRPDRGNDCFSICRLPMVNEAMPTLEFATIVGRLLTAAFDAGLHVCSTVYDNATYVEVLDSCLLGMPQALEKTNHARVPFCSLLQPVASHTILGVPYGVASFRAKIVIPRRNRIHNLVCVPCDVALVLIAKMMAMWLWVVFVVVVVRLLVFVDCLVGVGVATVVVVIVVVMLNMLLIYIYPHIPTWGILRLGSTEPK